MKYPLEIYEIISHLPETEIAQTINNISQYYTNT